jgi:hypothetical protein
VRKASVKLVESSVRIVGVLENLVIATGRYGSKIQDPKCRRSPRSLIESSQESEGSGPGIIQSSRVQSWLRSLVNSNQVREIQSSQLGRVESSRG